MSLYRPHLHTSRRLISPGLTTLPAGHDQCQDTASTDAEHSVGAAPSGATSATHKSLDDTIGASVGGAPVSGHVGSAAAGPDDACKQHGTQSAVTVVADGLPDPGTHLQMPSSTSGAVCQLFLSFAWRLSVYREFALC